MNKICKLVNDKFSWIMYVDEEEIAFDGHHNADYFAQHYSDLGYAIEWDRDEWREEKIGCQP